MKACRSPLWLFAVALVWVTVAASPHVRADDFDTLLTQGTAALHARKWQEAERHFLAASKLKPDSIAAQVGLGRARTEDGILTGSDAHYPNYDQALKLATAAGDKTQRIQILRTLAGLYKKNPFHAQKVLTTLEALREAEGPSPALDADLTRWRKELNPLEGLATETDQAWLLSTAQRFQSRSKYDVAIPLYSRLLELDPENSNALTRRAFLYKDRAGPGDLKASFEDFTRAAELDPRNALFKRSLAMAAMRMGNYAKAMEAMVALEAIDPDLGSMLIERARCHLELGDPDRALQDYDAYLALYPTSKDALGERGLAHLKKKDYDRALEAIATYAATDWAKGKPFFEKYYRARGVTDWQVSALNEMIKRHPEVMKYYEERGRLHRDRKNFDQALADFTIYAGENWNTARNLMEPIYKARGVKGWEIRVLNAAIARKPTPELHYHRAVERQGAKDHAGMRADLAEALRLKPDDRKFLLARAAMSVANKDWLQAVSDASRLLELNPKDCDALRERGFAYEIGGNFDLAYDDHDRAAQISPTHSHARDRNNLAQRRNTNAVHVLNNQGNQASSRGDQAAAIALYDRALAIDPRNHIVRSNRAYSILHLGDARRAQEEFRQVLATHSDYRYAREGLAMASARLDAIARAEKERVDAKNTRSCIACSGRGKVVVKGSHSVGMNTRTAYNMDTKKFEVTGYYAEERTTPDQEVKCNSCNGTGRVTVRR